MPPLWREIQRENFTDWDKLIDFLQLGVVKQIPKPRFPLNLPRRLAEKVVKGNREDPVLRQFLPSLEEDKQSPLFISDPVGDVSSRKASKLLHKYAGRALLLCTSACAMHCRYCFRQHFDYDTAEKSFGPELELIRQDPTLKEVLLSGGDPLSLSNRQLNELIVSLSEIPHVKRLRFHTRFPMGIPERIDEEFLAMLRESRLQTFFVIHSNHPQEWDADIFSAMKAVQKLGIPVLCQTVLLKGINDETHVLLELFEMLVDHGILPYYVHQLDRVAGAAHFEVPEEKGIALMKDVSSRISGYAVPRYVREVAGADGKSPIG